MKLRIAIQEVQGKKFKHKHNIMLETNNLNDIVIKLRLVLAEEISYRQDLLNQYLLNRTPDYINTIIRDWPKDLIDWASKGSDITKREFLENEIFFALLE